MIKHSNPTLNERRITKFLRLLKPLIHPQSVPVTVEAWHVGGEPVPYEVAVKADYKPFSVGDEWGPAWDTSWFRIRGAVPAEWAGRDTAVLFELNNFGREGFTTEGLIYSKGKPVRAINRNRNEIEVSPEARGSETFEFYIEAAANVAPKMDPNWELSVIAPSGAMFKLEKAELSFIDHEIQQYYHDFRVATEVMLVLPVGSQRRAELLYALNE